MTEYPTPVAVPESPVVRWVEAAVRNRRYIGGAGLAVFGPMALSSVILEHPLRLLVVMGICNLCSYLAGAGSHGSDREQRERQARRRAARLAGLK